MWTAQAGDALDEPERLRNHKAAVELVSAAAHFSASLLLLLRVLAVPVSNRALLAALLGAHHQLCLEPDCLAAALGNLKAPTQVVQARQAVAQVLGAWLDAKWKPGVVQGMFNIRPPSRGFQVEDALDNSANPDGSSAQRREPAATNQSPEAAYTAMCLLGDLLPPEWPPQQAATAAGQKDGTSGLPAPEMPARRSALAVALEEVQVQLRRLVGFAAGSESRMMRCAAVRVCSRAAGLSGSMGMFLAQPLLEHLQVRAGWAGKQGCWSISSWSISRIYQLLMMHSCW